MHAIFKRIALIFVDIYRKTSPYRPKRCRFYPTCSDYSYQSIEKHGFIYGIYLAVMRIIRCHPLNKGGYDPIP